MARILSSIALILAYITTLFFIAAMATPWWFTRYHPVGQTEDQFYGSNPSIDPHTGLFFRTNCFIDGSCITGGQIYKNNSSLQWVYTTILVLMIIAWVPWLFFVHLLHFRANKNRYDSRSYRPLMVISALLAWFLILAAVLVFGIGMYKTNGVYNAGGLYGDKNVLSQNGLVGIGSDNNGQTLNKRQSGVSGPNGWNGPSGPSGPSGPVFPTRDESSTFIPSGPATSSDGGITVIFPSATTEFGTATVSDVETTVVVVTTTVVEATTTIVDATTTIVDATTAVDASTTSVEATTTPLTTDTIATTAVDPLPREDGNIPEQRNDFGYTGLPRDQNLYFAPFAFGTLPYGNQGYTLLGAGIPVFDEVNSTDAFVGDIAYQWGVNSAWFFAIFTLALIPLTLILALAFKSVEPVVATQQTVVSRPPVVGSVIPAMGSAIPAMGAQQPAVLSSRAL